MQPPVGPQDAQPVLYFVYNAQSGFLNMLKDAVHKTVSPQTYPCKLCDITYSPVRMRSQWKRFIRELPFAVEFSYVDLVAEQLDLENTRFPAAFLKTSEGLQPWLSAAQINEANTLDELMQLVLEHLPAQSPACDPDKTVNQATTQH
ncbi:MAG: hypothetical protein HKN70_04950 [Gammaproteobacteria bacterium]|nr:hypothetical protein [Gammaproteobacteria bacterium]